MTERQTELGIAFEKFRAAEKGSPEEDEAFEELVEIIFGKCEPCEP